MKIPVMTVFILNETEYIERGEEFEASGAWFSLPVDMQEVTETIGAGRCSMAILGAPFQLGEVDNFPLVNRFAELVEENNIQIQTIRKLMFYGYFLK